MKTTASLILRFVLLMPAVILLNFAKLNAQDTTTAELTPPEEYRLVVEGFDWGPAVSKIILNYRQELESLPEGTFTVDATRSSNQTELPEALRSGTREVIGTYISDVSGNRVPTSQYLTLVLSVGPHLPFSSPFHYLVTPNFQGNIWIDYQVSVSHSSSKRVWDVKTGTKMRLVNYFDLDNSYEYAPGKTLTYAHYRPKGVKEKKPLIIWLHGGGEGGTDTTVPLLANRAANYASHEIQRIFGRAYVLVPQTPTFWMNRPGGGYTTGDVEDIYNEGLMALIQDYVEQNPGIDPDRIYLGGCSNGGYMTIKLLLKHPDFFAAGFPSALAYSNEYISDQEVEILKDLPIWFIHSADDPVTRPETTVVPLYKRLMAAGAENIHFSYYKHVVDITGQYGGNDFYYNGHFSWIYSHANEASLDFDGKPVTVDGKPVKVMEWLAAQKR